MITTNYSRRISATGPSGETPWGGDSGVTPDNSAANHTQWSWVGTSVPQGTKVSDIGSMVANFTWQYGENHGGGLRFVVATPDGEIWVHYGDLSNTFQSGTEGSGVDMRATTEARVEASQLGVSPMYTTWNNVLGSSVPASSLLPAGTTIGDEPVQYVALVIDGGWGAGQGSLGVPAGTHDQVLNLSSVVVGLPSGPTTFTWPAATSGVVDNSQPAWIYLYKASGATPPAQVSESLLTSTQGDSGGQFRQVDSMYMYNLPVSNLPDPSASYKVGISFNQDGSNPVGVVNFGTK